MRPGYSRSEFGTLIEAGWCSGRAPSHMMSKNPRPENKHVLIPGSLRTVRSVSNPTHRGRGGTRASLRGELLSVKSVTDPRRVCQWSSFQKAPDAIETAIQSCLDRIRGKPKGARRDVTSSTRQNMSGSSADKPEPRKLN